ncbi:MAG: hypothetical protein HY059_24455, partial [Proteobacteria bacterium]|nr:hypothetical protein [Pseudomonadota bacterium]
ALGDAQGAIDSARAASTDRAAVVRHLEIARRAIAAARVPEPLADRLARNTTRLERAIALAGNGGRAGPPQTARVSAPAVVRNIPPDGIARPDGARVAYLGGGLDQVGGWLGALGIDVVDMPAFDGQSLVGGGFTTAVVGIRAFERRDDLHAHIDALHAFVRAGGHLVTLYHRADKGWQPARTPLARIEIGRPSIRWRVCDPAAPVGVAAPGHRLLTAPNAIGPADWAGWRRERGLCFASAWDPAYVPLFGMADPGEVPLQGGLLSGRFGRGRHTHVALALHNEIEFGTTGALRLLCNLVAPEPVEASGTEPVCA